MQRILKIMQWILTVATVGTALLLCWQCLDIYLTGNQSDNISAGVYLSPVYSAQIVSERLSKVEPLLVIYAVFAALTIVAQICWGKPSRPAGKIHPCPPRVQSRKTVSIMRLVVVCLGVLFIILGVMNGGSRDVLVKAINICTECIGLG